MDLSELETKEFEFFCYRGRMINRQQKASLMLSCSENLMWSRIIALTLNINTAGLLINDIRLSIKSEHWTRHRISTEPRYIA